MPKLEYVFYNFGDCGWHDAIANTGSGCVCVVRVLVYVYLFIYQAFEYQIKWNSLLKLIASIVVVHTRCLCANVCVKCVENENTSQWDNLLGWMEFSMT